MSDKDLTAEEIRAEHLGEVDQRAHWLFLVAVLVGGTLLMLGLIAVLGTSG
jgi:hypothetical protein